MAEFKRRDVDEYARSLAAYLPEDELFAAKSVEGSNLHGLLRGMAAEMFRVNGYLREYGTQIFPNITERFLDEWEAALGIPDGCFSGTGSIDERRRDVLIKLAALGVQTVDDFVALAAMFGLTVEVVSGSESGVFPLSFPVLVFGTAEDARFTIVVNIETPLSLESTFPYTFPVPFKTEIVGVLRCVFKRLKPANCNLIIRQVG